MTSCVGCKFLYTHGTGYSNWTWEDTIVNCAHDCNPNLPASEPSDWTRGGSDHWPATNTSRCGLYDPGEMVALDIDGDVYPDTHTNDREAIAAIEAHSGRRRPNPGEYSG